jgi:hypothetical protein
MEYSEDVTVHGITGYRYVMSDSLKDNGTTDSSTQCNCGGECLPQGVINVTECMFSSPSYISNPHFLGADPFYIHQVKGMKPDPHIHSFYITVEPVSSPLHPAENANVKKCVSADIFGTLKFYRHSVLHRSAPWVRI